MENGGKGRWRKEGIVSLSGVEDMVHNVFDSAQTDNQVKISLSSFLPFVLPPFRPSSLSSLPPSSPTSNNPQLHDKKLPKNRLAELVEEQDF
jgi:hypothetical protein